MNHGDATLDVLYRRNLLSTTNIYTFPYLNSVCKGKLYILYHTYIIVWKPYSPFFFTRPTGGMVSQRRVKMTFDKKEYYRKYYQEHKKEPVIKKLQTKILQTPEEKNEYRRKYRASHREEAKLLTKKWREKHPDEIKEYSKTYYKEHLEECKAYGKKYREEHPEKFREWKKKYREKNREAVNLRGRKWMKDHPAYYASITRKRKYRIRGSSDGSITLEFEEMLYKQQGGLCAYCKRNMDEVGRHLDHIIPVSKGGIHTTSNVHWTCPRCNLSKGSKDEKEWLENQTF